jgi:hypothetical protein
LALSLQVVTSARLFGLAMGFLLGDKAGGLLATGARLFGLAMGFLLGDKAGGLLATGARLFGLAMGFLLGHKAGGLFATGARLFGLAAGFLFGRNACSVLAAPRLFGLAAVFLRSSVVGLLLRPVGVLGRGFNGFTAAGFSLGPKPQRAHHADCYGGCAHETEPTDEPDDPHDARRSGSSYLFTVVHFRSGPRTEQGGCCPRPMRCGPPMTRRADVARHIRFSASPRYEQRSTLEYFTAC